MEFAEVVEGRRSIRHFTNEEIPDEDIRKIIAIGTLAPNAGNRQDWRCLVFKDNSTKNEIKELVQEKLESLAKRAGKENQLRPI